MYDQNQLNEINLEKDIFQKVHIYKGRTFDNPIIEYNNILEYFRLSARKYPDSPFIIEVVDGNEKKIVSYGTAYFIINKLAYYIKEHYDINLNSRVAILPSNSCESFYMILAILLCGAVAVIINPNEPLERIRAQINAVECSKIFIDLTYSHHIDNMILIQEVLEALDGISGNVEVISSINNEQAAIVMYTTGTTSASKPILQMHYNIAVNCYALITHHNLTNNTRLMCTLPIFYANGLEFTLFATMMAGASVVLCNRFDPLSFFKVLQKYEVHIASLVPSMLNTLTEIKNFSELKSLNYFVTAAAPLSKITSNLVWKKFNKKIIQGYGLTETTNFSTLLPNNLSEHDYSTLMLEPEIPSVGSEILGNEVVILDSIGNIVDEGIEGEICMRGHNIMAGYINNSEANKECFKGGWFHSGDLGKFIRLDNHHNKKFLCITGRIKNIIKINGQALSLDEMDRIIFTIPGVKDCVTCSIYDEYAGEAPVCLIVKDNNSLEEETIFNYLSKTFSKERLPRKILFTDFIPRTKNGKLNRSMIANQFFS